MCLSQLGLKIQHALRAFTAKDRKAIKLAAENYPDSDYYETAKVLTELGIGEALVSALNEKGIPTPLVKTMLRAPMSRMDVLTDSELEQLIDKSQIAKRYNEVIDSESAYEILNKKIQTVQKEVEANKKTATKSKSSSRSTINPVIKVLTSATFIRGVFGILKQGFKEVVFMWI